MNCILFLLVIACILWGIPWLERLAAQRKHTRDRIDRTVQYYRFTKDGNCPHCGTSLARYLIDVAESMTEGNFPESQLPDLECPNCHRRLNP